MAPTKMQSVIFCSKNILGIGKSQSYRVYQWRKLGPISGGAEAYS